MCLTYSQRRPRADQRRRGRVLRFLPTNLSAPEIADQLSLSVHTVRTHMRNVYAKLGAHGRT
ncbi:MAG: helix-turn-helix transcriptional regulator [Trebonia sp.]